MSYNKKTQMFEGYIYMITNIKNTKKYIGQTKTTISERYSSHKYCAKRGKVNNGLYEDMRLYGVECFHISELEKVECATIEELTIVLNELEIYYISTFDTVKNGFNQNKGGGGRIESFTCRPCNSFDEDGNLLKSFSSCFEAGRYYDICIATPGCICRGLTPYTKIKGKKVIFRFDGDAFDKYSIYRSSVIYQFDLCGNYICSYDTPQELKNAFKINSISGVYRAINKKQKIYGFYFSREKIFDYIPHRDGTAGSIDQYDYDGNYINTFLSAREASMSFNGTENGNWEILKCCRGELSYARGYVWRFKDEPFDKYPLDLSMSFYRSVCQYSLDGKYITSYISSNHAYRSITGRNDSKGAHILGCCKGHRRLAYGYVWRFEGDSFDKYPLTKKLRSDRKTVVQMDKLTKQILGTYEGLDDAVMTLKKRGISVSKTGVARACKNKSKAYGYLWQYA